MYRYPASEAMCSGGSNINSSRQLQCVLDFIKAPASPHAARVSEKSMKKLAPSPTLFIANADSTCSAHNARSSGIQMATILEQGNTWPSGCGVSAATVTCCSSSTEQKKQGRHNEPAAAPPDKLPNLPASLRVVRIAELCSSNLYPQRTSGHANLHQSPQPA